MSESKRNINVGFRVSEDRQEELKILAAKRRQSIQQMLEQGLGLLLTGMPQPLETHYADPDRPVESQVKALTDRLVPGEVLSMRFDEDKKQWAWQLWGEKEYELLEAIEMHRDLPRGNVHSAPRESLTSGLSPEDRARVVALIEMLSGESTGVEHLDRMKAPVIGYLDTWASQTQKQTSGRKQSGKHA